MPSLELIDWPALAANTLWILGLALLLVRAGWLLAFPKGPARQCVPYAWLTPAGTALFCSGLGFTTGKAVEQIIWFFLAGLVLFLAVYERIKMGRQLS